MSLKNPKIDTESVVERFKVATSSQDDTLILKFMAWDVPILFAKIQKLKNDVNGLEYRLDNLSRE